VQHSGQRVAVSTCVAAALAAGGSRSQKAIYDLQALPVERHELADRGAQGLLQAASGSGTSARQPT
jgi:hypothetical protein